MPPSLTTKEMRLALAGAIVLQFAVALLLRRLMGPSQALEPAMVMWAYAVLPSLSAIIWIWFAAVWSEPDGWARVGFAWIDRRWLGRAVALGALSVPAVMLITALTRPIMGPSRGPPLPIETAEAWSQPGFLLALGLGVVVLGPLMEEMVFRGLLYGWLRRHMGLWQAAAIAAAGHAMVHFDLGALLGLFAFFVFLGWIYERARSLWVPAIIHGTHNLLILAMQ